MSTQTVDPNNMLGIKPNVDKDGAPSALKIHLTERAAKKIRALLEKDGVSPEVGGLRVGVQGGGCSGLSYAMRLDTQARDRDKVFEEFGAKLFVDPKSFLYLNGTTLEYEETLMRQGFVFQNPNAARNCGCGSSFTA
jgi:iron-sulfur cluster assembly protein